MEIFKGRYSARYDKDFIVYVFGLKINKPWKVRSWFGVMKYSYKMRTYLMENPQLGMLHAERGFVHGTPAVITYWNSFEELERFSRDPDHLHISGWRWYNTIHKSADVGMWHEMYKVRANEFAALYAHMPQVGMASVGKHVPVGSTLKTAAQRLGVRDTADGYPAELVGNDGSEYEAVDRAEAAQRNGQPVAETASSTTDERG